MVLKLGSYVWGALDVPRAIAFWCAALDYIPLRAPTPDWAILVPRNGPGPQIAINEMRPERDVGYDALKQRHHLDLYADDAEKEIERLVALGGKRAEREYAEGADYVVLEDTEGNTFCVVEKKGLKEEGWPNAKMHPSFGGSTGE